MTLESLTRATARFTLWHYGDRTMAPGHNCSIIFFTHDSDSPIFDTNNAGYLRHPDQLSVLLLFFAKGLDAPEGENDGGGVGANGSVAEKGVCRPGGGANGCERALARFSSPWPCERRAAGERRYLGGLSHFHDRSLSRRVGNQQ